MKGKCDCKLTLFLLRGSSLKILIGLVSFFKGKKLALKERRNYSYPLTSRAQIGDWPKYLLKSGCCACEHDFYGLFTNDIIVFGVVAVAVVVSQEGA